MKESIGPLCHVSSCLFSEKCSVTRTCSTADFAKAGDVVRSSGLTNLASLLAHGIRVALIYGDADYICNWMGGEAVSLALARLGWQYPAGAQHQAYTQYPYAPFAEAGYADLVVNDSYVGGAVRQFGNLSFARVYDAGHMVPAYQPETAFKIFTRVINGLDIATGKPVNSSNFSTRGPTRSTHDNSKTYNSSSPGASPTCWIRSWRETCTENQAKALSAGLGGVRDGVWHLDNE